MVSSQNPVSTTDVSGRGFVAESTTISSRPITSTGAFPVNTGWFAGIPQFWGSVIAGTLLAYSIAIMSEALMFGCHVGTISNGALSFGWGAAIWIVVTSCVAYFFGGWAASCFSKTGDGGWLRGLGVWALSLPLTIMIGAFVSMGAGLMYGPQNSGHMTEYVANTTHSATLFHGNLFVSYGGAWTVFCALILGLCFAIIGGFMTPAPSTDRDFDLSRVTTTNP